MILNLFSREEQWGLTMALPLRWSLSFTLSIVTGKRYWLCFGKGSSGRTDMHVYRHTDLLRQCGDFWHLETLWDLVTRPYHWRQRQALKESPRLIQQLQIKVPPFIWTFKDVSKIYVLKMSVFNAPPLFARNVLLCLCKMWKFTHSSATCELCNIQSKSVLSSVSFTSHVYPIRVSGLSLASLCPVFRHI